MLMIDLILNIDSLYLKDGETVDDVIAHIREKYDFGYESFSENKTLIKEQCSQK